MWSHQKEEEWWDEPEVVGGRWPLKLAPFPEIQGGREGFKSGDGGVWGRLA